MPYSSYRENYKYKISKSEQQKIDFEEKKSMYIQAIFDQRKENFLDNLPSEEKNIIYQEELEIEKLDTLHKNYIKKIITAKIIMILIDLCFVVLLVPFYFYIKNIGINETFVIFLLIILFSVEAIILSVFHKKDKKIIEKKQNLEKAGFQIQKLNELRQSILCESEVRLTCSPWKCDPYTYETQTAEYFKSIGYTDVKTTSKSGDYGADVLAISPAGERIAIQCKQYNKKVDQKPIREVLGAMEFYHYDKGYVVTTIGYTKAAIELAKASNVRLFVSNDLTWGLDEVFAFNNGQQEQKSTYYSKSYDTKTINTNPEKTDKIISSSQSRIQNTNLRNNINQPSTETVTNDIYSVDTHNSLYFPENFCQRLKTGDSIDNWYMSNNIDEKCKREQLGQCKSVENTNVQKETAITEPSCKKVGHAIDNCRKTDNPNSSKSVIKVTTFNFYWENTPDSLYFTKVAFDPIRKVLAVVFKATNITYIHYNFSEGLWQKFRTADSIDNWYMLNIDGKYKREQLGQ